MRSVSWLGLACLAGCFPQYAPPVRGLAAGMPGRLSPGQLEVAVTAGGVTIPTLGGAQVAYCLSEGVSAEAGVNANVVEVALAPWATGWAGVRFTRGTRTISGARIVGDAELGAGAGAGGRNGRDRWDRLFAYGLYEGLGVGVQWRWLGVYARARLDAAASNAAPTTLWPTLMAGLEVRPSRRISFGAGGGYGGYWNTADGLVNGWFYQGQLTFFFDLSRRSD